MRHNRYIAATFHKRTGATRDEIINIDLDEGYDGSERENHLPLDISCHIYKHITSNPDVATIQIKNPLQIEKLYQENNFFFEQFSQNNYELEIIIGYLDDSSPIEVVFTGDIMDLNVSGGDELTDQTLTFKAVAGYNAYRHGIVRNRFDAGATYRKIIKYIFDEVWQKNFGIQLKDENIVDPEGLLETKKLRSFSMDRPGERILSDISRGIEPAKNDEQYGFVWGVGPMHNGFRQAYFVDKRAIFDLRGDTTARVLNYKTGRIGRIGYGLSSFSFDHFPDTKIDIGNLIKTSDSPAINSNVDFVGRVNAINMSLSNKGDHRYSVECAFIGSDGLAVLTADRVNVASQAL